MRSIPNMMDGLKTSLRKILYSAFKKRLVSEIKVAQFSGYVSENSCYHHGEMSLNAAIVGMAQNFVGSNNINLLQPLGQFGTRRRGGDDSASERYIFTALSPITRAIFPEADDHILEYLEDDGYPVEPKYYLPIIPMTLVNSSRGIGTGFSTEVLGYNPVEIIQHLRKMLAGKQEEFVGLPYWDGFTGTVERIGEKYICRGKYEKIGADKIRVTELPVGFWTCDFKDLLEDLMSSTDKKGNKIAPTVKDYDDMSKTVSVHFEITLAKDTLAKLEAQKHASCNGVEKMFKLCSTFSTTNMHLFDPVEKLYKYATVNDIIRDYFKVRLAGYDKRKTYIIETLKRELCILQNKERYILETLKGDVDLRKKTKEQVRLLMTTRKYSVIDGDEDYKYLVKMPMDSVTEENVESIVKECAKKKAELEDVMATTVQQMWNRELDALEKEYAKFREDKSRQMSEDVGDEAAKQKKKISLKSRK